MMTKSAPPMFTDNGNGFDMTQAGVLLILGDMFYGNDPELTGAARTRTGEFVADILQAAATGGFKQADIFITMLTRKQRSARLGEMAQAASDAAGEQAYSEAMGRFRRKDVDD